MKIGSVRGELGLPMSVPGPSENGEVLICVKMAWTSGLELA